MKYGYLLFILLASIFFFECATKNKITYNIPADYPEARKTQIIQAFNKGQVLYKANCTECHGIFTLGKDGIPNFTHTQMDNYSVRFLRRDPKNHAVVINMSMEQLNEVLTFLRYRKMDTTATAKAK